MRILLSLLLIPFFVLGQALPHSHTGTCVGEPSDHAARPHMHLSDGHSHHGHHDGSDHHHTDPVSDAEGVAAVGVVSLSALLDHDADAIYVAQSSTIGRISTVLPSDTASALASVDCWTCPPAVFSAPSDNVAYRRDDGLPIYLLVNSFRL